MAAPSHSQDTVDPFGIAATLHDWCCLMQAAEEIRDVDAEMMETMLEAERPGPVPPSSEEAAKLQNLMALMRSLSLDPEAVRQSGSDTMRALEAACMECMERTRCAQELRAGTAPRTYRTFCPNASRITRLLPA